MPCGTLSSILCLNLPVISILNKCALIQIKNFVVREAIDERGSTVCETQSWYYNCASSFSFLGNMVNWDDIGTKIDPSNNCGLLLTLMTICDYLLKNNKLFNKI